MERICRDCFWSCGCDEEYNEDYDECRYFTPVSGDYTPYDEQAYRADMKMRLEAYEEILREQD